MRQKCGLSLSALEIILMARDREFSPPTPGMTKRESLKCPQAICLWCNPAARENAKDINQAQHNLEDSWVSRISRALFILNYCGLVYLRPNERTKPEWPSLALPKRAKCMVNTWERCLDFILEFSLDQETVIRYGRSNWYVCIVIYCYFSGKCKSLCAQSKCKLRSTRRRSYCACVQR